MITEKIIKEWLKNEGTSRNKPEAIREIEKFISLKGQEVCKTASLISRTAGRRTTLLCDVQAAIELTK